MIQIPIYRAKKKDSDEYIIGYLTESKSGMDLEFTNFMILPFLNLKEHEVVQTDYESIDPSTLSIHFPDMLDSQGNKIFASLSKDGKGGDIMKDDEYYGVAIYLDCELSVVYEGVIDNISNENFEVIGIQQ